MTQTEGGTEQVDGATTSRGSLSFLHKFGAGAAVLATIFVLGVILAGVVGASYANTWQSRAATPATIGTGGEGRLVAAAGSDTIFALRGGNTTTFYRYIISGNSWAQMDSVPAGIGNNGCALAQAGNDTLFALRGDTTTFYRYRISSNSWDTMAPIPAAISSGGALVQAGNDTIFAFRGGTSTNFFRYRISSNSWDTLVATPAGISGGGALAQVGSDTIFALQGAGVTDFFRYTISGDSWTSMAAFPASVGQGGSLLYPGTGDFIYATRGNGQNTFFRYSISANSWVELAASPAVFGGGGGLAYPGTGSILYAIHGENAGSTAFSRYFISASPPDTPTSIAQAKMDSTPIAVGGSISDTTSIRFDVRASSPSDTFRIQVELRPADTVFTSPVNVTIDTVVFFQSGFSTSNAAETLSITVNGLAANSYHWQVRVVDAAGDSTGWVRIDGSGTSTHFVIGAETTLPVASVVSPTDTRVTANAPIATTESYVQINLPQSATITAGVLKNASDSVGTNAVYICTSTLVNSTDSVVIPIWTNQGRGRIFIGLRSDTGTLGASGNLPSGITATAAGRAAFGATVILTEFADSTPRLLGDSRTTTNIGDSFAYTLRYFLSEAAVARYRSLGFDTNAGSGAFRFWYADTYGGAWTMDTTVTVTVAAAPAPWNLLITVSGITKDLPGGLGGAGSATVVPPPAGGVCVIDSVFGNTPMARAFPAMRGARDALLGSSIGRILVGGYYSFAIVGLLGAAAVGMAALPQNNEKSGRS